MGTGRRKRGKGDRNRKKRDIMSGGEKSGVMWNFTLRSAGCALRDGAMVRRAKLLLLEFPRRSDGETCVTSPAGIPETERW